MRGGPPTALTEIGPVASSPQPASRKTAAASRIAGGKRVTIGRQR
jgi:hypothetical protein